MGYSLIIISAYTGSVTSFTTTKPYLWKPMNSLDQFKYSSMEYLVRKGFSEEKLFADDQTLKDKMMYVPYNTSKSKRYNWYEKPLEMIVQNPRKYVSIGTRQIEGTIQQFYMDTNGQHNFHISRNRFSISMSGFFFKKGSLYQEAFNIQVSYLWKFGIIQYFYELDDNFNKQRNLRNARWRNRTKSSTSTNEKQCAGMSGGCFVLICGLILALVTLVLEKLKNFTFMA